jgi:hypothetical protein
MNYLMACLGYEKISPEDLIHKPRYAPFCSLQHVNASPPILKALANHNGLKVVIPLRAPVHQFLTRSGEAAHAQRVKEESKTLWKRLNDLKDTFDYVFLPIEEDMDRKKRLMLVANHLDAIPDEEVFGEIVSNWAKVGSSGVKPHRVHYDKHGTVNVGGFNMTFLDEEMERYSQWIETYREELNGSS